MKKLLYVVAMVLLASCGSSYEGVVVYKFHESEHIREDADFNGKFFTRSTSVDDEDWGLVLNYNGEHGIVRVSESEWNQVCVGEYFYKSN
jgi:uncharacterized lipoprotein YmbA